MKYPNSKFFWLLVLYIYRKYTKLKSIVFQALHFHYEKYILKGKLKQFYCLYLVASVSLGYLFASFILDFVTIHF